MREKTGVAPFVLQRMVKAWISASIRSEEQFTFLASSHWGGGGRFVTCGCTSGPSAETDLARIFWNQLSILGSTMGDMSEFHAVVDLFLQGRLRPVVDQVVAPAGIREAYAALEAGSQFGKLVVDWRT